MLALRAGAEESKDGWSCLLQDVRTRGGREVDPIRTTNAIESFLRNVRQRTDQMDAFTTETSCLTSVWAVMQDIRLPKIPVGSCIDLIEVGAKQPAGSGGGGVCQRSCVTTALVQSFF